MDAAAPCNTGPRQHPFSLLGQCMEAQAGTLAAGESKQPQMPDTMDGTPAHSGQQQLLALE